ncbi:hypothetical protein QL093DRAFT_2082311 [Fusarium oxysporum]|nr:hypothetical protein QL093DRAFT_2082311 [Fusarium oxysporum]
MATTAMIQPNPPKRSDSDVSPRTVNPPRNSASEDAKVDYFPDSNTVDGSNTSVRASDGDDSSARKSSISFAPDPRRSSSCESNQNSVPGQDSTIQRKSSTGSVSFRRMTNPQLPQGNPQQMNNSRIRASSPNHSRIVISPTDFILRTAHEHRRNWVQIGPAGNLCDAMPSNMSRGLCVTIEINNSVHMGQPFPSRSDTSIAVAASTV